MSHVADRTPLRDEAPSRSPRWSLTLWLLIGASVPFAIGFAQILLAARDPFHLVGDQALIDLAVLRSLEFSQFTGPYSRFGWDHPGPLYYYFLAPGTLLSGGLGIYLGALLTNWLFVGLAVVLVSRNSPPRTAVALVTALMIFLYALGPGVLRDPWNPAIVVLPLLVAALAIAVRPTVSSVCLAVLGASLALQAHFGTINMVASIVLVLGGVHLLRVLPVTGWLGGELVPRLRSSLIVVGVGLVCWALPLIEQLRNGREGNLFRVLWFNLAAEGPRNSLGDAARAVLGASWLPSTPLLLAPPVVPGSVWLWVAGWATVAAIGCALAWRRQLRVPFVLNLLSIVGLVVVTVAVSRIIGTIQLYLLWWAPLPCVALIAGWLTLVFGEGGLLLRAPRALAAVVLALVVANGALTLTASVDNRVMESPEVGEATQLIQRRLDAPGSVVLEMPDPDAWPVADGVAAMLVDVGRPVVVPGRPEAFPTDGGDAPVAATVRIAMVDSGNDTGGVRLGTVGNAPGLSVRLIEP